MMFSKFRLTAGELLSLVVLLIVLSAITVVLLARGCSPNSGTPLAADSCDSLTVLIEETAAHRADSASLRQLNKSKKTRRKKDARPERRKPVGRNYLDESADE